MVFFGKQHTVDAELSQETNVRHSENGGSGKVWSWTIPLRTRGGNNVAAAAKERSRAEEHTVCIFGPLLRRGSRSLKDGFLL